MVRDRRPCPDALININDYYMYMYNIYVCIAIYHLKVRTTLITGPSPLSTPFPDQMV